MRPAAVGVYKWSLAHLGFLPAESIITVVCQPGSNLYGQTKLEAALHALFQRMERASVARSCNGLVFFDEGHGEYRKIFRRARRYLVTGSSQGAWASGRLSRNIPMAHFVKDANFKDSRHSLLVQLVDMIAYAALQKARARTGACSPWQTTLGLHDAYNLIPTAVLNTRASTRDPQGIVWL
jgi:hypothetical protein